MSAAVFFVYPGLLAGPLGEEADFACSLFAEIWEVLFGLSCTGL